jgi:hypothetical protein
MQRAHNLLAGTWVLVRGASKHFADSRRPSRWVLVPRVPDEENRVGVDFPAGVNQTNSLGKRGRKRREAALAEPTLLPGVCPRSDVTKLDAKEMGMVANLLVAARFRVRFD